MSSTNQTYLVPGSQPTAQPVGTWLFSRIQNLRTTASAQLSNVQDANFAQVSMEFSNQQAAFQAALRAGASIVQESLLEFLH